MFPGIADRMQKELTALAPSSVKVCRALHLPFLMFNGPCYPLTGQDCSASGTQIFRLDWWLYFSFSQYLPECLVLQTRV